MQNKVYVGNLSYTASDEDIRQFFGEFGNITKVNIPHDRETKRPRGFAFVEFDSAEGAQNALQANSTNFMGRDIKVNIAKEREDREGGRGGAHR